MIAVVHFSVSTGLYTVDYPKHGVKSAVTLDEVALFCDEHGYELHYKGRAA